MLRNYHVLPKKVVLISLVLGIALGLRLYHLGHENFWIDEVAYVQDASGSPSEILDYSTSSQKTLRRLAPLPHLLSHFFISPENPERTARLPSAMFGTLEVLVLFIFGTRLFSFNVGLLAALFLALSPLHLWYSQEARWYAQWSFMTTCSYLALLYVWRNNRATSWIYYGLTTILNVYTFIYSWIVIALQTLGVWFSRGVREAPRRFLVRMFAVQALAAGAALPILWLTLHRLDRASGTPRPVGLGDLPYTFFTYAAGFSAGPTVAELHALPSMLNVLAGYPITLVFLVIYFPAIILGVRKALRDQLASALVLPWLFGLPGLVYLVASATKLTYEVRYTFPSVAAFVLILSCGVLSLQSKIRKVGLMSAILLCSLLSISNFYWNTRYDREHVKAAIGRINGANIGKSPILSIGQIGSAAKYYGNGLDIVIRDRCDSAGTEDPLNEGSLNGSKTVWVIAGRDWNDRATACLNELSRSYSIIDHQRFTGTDLWLLKRRD